MANYYSDRKEIKFELENSPLMERIVEQIDELKQRSPSLRAYLGASAGRESFYERFGFVTRRSAGLGAGMVRF